MTWPVDMRWHARCRHLGNSCRWQTVVGVWNVVTIVMFAMLQQQQDQGSSSIWVESLSHKLSSSEKGISLIKGIHQMRSLLECHMTLKEIFLMLMRHSRIQISSKSQFCLNCQTFFSGWVTNFDQHCGFDSCHLKNLLSLVNFHSVIWFTFWKYHQDPLGNLFEFCVVRPLVWFPKTCFCQICSRFMQLYNPSLDR